MEYSLVLRQNNIWTCFLPRRRKRVKVEFHLLMTVIPGMS
ncbi:hypothetical protein V6Z11_A13G050200 [Gossypium hirsutum]